MTSAEIYDALVSVGLEFTAFGDPIWPVIRPKGCPEHRLYRTVTDPFRGGNEDALAAILQAEYFRREATT